MTPIPGLSCIPLPHLTSMAPRQRDEYVAGIYRKGRAAGERSAPGETKELRKAAEDALRESRHHGNSAERMTKEVKRLRARVIELEDSFASDRCRCRPPAASDDAVIMARRAVLESIPDGRTRKATA